MDNFKFETLVSSIETGQVARTLLSYHVNLYKFIINKSSPIDSNSQTFILQQLESQIDYFQDDKNKEKLDLVSQPLRVAIAKNYVTILGLNKHKLFDTTNRFVTLFADISKKKSHYTALKNLSCVLLSFIYESFGHELLSFVALLNSTILRYLKKNQESKTIIADYSLNLSNLLSVILRNGGITELDESISTKFLKLFKHTINDDSSSIQLIANLYESWGIISTHKKPEHSVYQLAHSSVILAGLGSKEKIIRVSCAKALAESLKLVSFKLKTVFSIYIELYIEGNLFAKVGITESIIQFLHLHVAEEYEYFLNHFEEVLSLLLSIFDHERVHSASRNCTSRIINQIDYIFETLLKLTGESGQRMIFDKLFKSYLNSEEKEHPFKIITVLKIVKKVLSNLSSLSEADLEYYQITMMKLCTSSNFEIRIHSVEIIKTFAAGFPHLINELLDTSFNELANNYKQASEKRLNFVKTHGLSLIIANLISLADKDYVPFELLLNIWDLVTSKLRTKNQGLKDSVVYYTILTSWIVMCGLFNYQDPEFMESKKVEFISLWENLDFIKPDVTLPDELFKALEVESHSLTALLNFLSNINIDSKIALDFAGFLSKRKTIISTIIPETKEVENLLNLIDQRILEIYLKIIHLIKNDVNSLVLIQAIKNFANLPNYEVVKNEKLDLWQIDDGFSNGLTSKFRGYEIDELNIKYSTPQSTKINSTDYSIDTVSLPPGSIELNSVKSWLTTSTWIDQLELTTLQPISPSLTNDFFITIYGDSQYSLKNNYSLPPSTVIVDTSIEILSLAFPYLSTKVQLSLIENMRSFILSKNINEATKTTVSINCSVAIHGFLSVAQSEGLKFDQSVGSSVLDVLRTLYETYPSPYLLNLNSDSIGIIISKTSLSEQIPIFIKKIVDDQQSGSRSFSSLVLAAIYKYNSSHFSQIFEILMKLASDPHPTVHSWTLDAFSTLIEKHVAMNVGKAKEMISMLEMFFLDDNYGAFNKSAAMSNLNVNVDSNKVLAKLLRHIINSLGPGVKDLDEVSKQTLQNLINGLLFYYNDEVIQSEIIKLVQELIIYDINAIDKQILIDLIEFNISNNLVNVIGTGLTLPLYGEKNEIFPVTSSFKVFGVSLDLLFQIVKTSEDKQFLSQVEYLIWIALETYPESTLLNKMIKEWLDSTYDISWFAKLQKLFNVSKRTLHEKLFNNYKAILSKYTHKKVEVDVNDEEAQSIAKKGEGEEEDSKSNESVNWKFKIVLLGYIRQLLGYTQRDSKLYTQLSSKVSDLIKISFSSSTSTINELRLLGIELLGDVINNYASAKDPIYPTMSLLEQQQAQITSALVPAFHYDSTPIIASKAITVVANFIGSRIVKINRLGRILKILTDSLDDLHESDDFKLQDVHITSIRGQRRVKLSVLNAWAELKILATSNEDAELNALIEEHLDVLLPLWVATLKEFAIIKHGSGDEHAEHDIELYERCWINFVDVVGCIVEVDETKIVDLLQNDSFGFFFMLYAQAIHSMIGHDHMKVRTLKALSKVLSYKKLVELILQDEIFSESIEVFERLILTGNIEEQSEILNITSKIFLNFFESSLSREELESYVDKLFELVRVNIQSIIRLVPYLQPENNRISTEVEELNPSEQQLLKKSFALINKMLARFPDMIKVDLYSSLLKLVLLVYEDHDRLVLRNQVIPSILPILKSLLQELVDMNNMVTINNFYQSIRPHLKVSQDVTSNINSLLSMGVLLSTSNDILRLNDDDIDFIATNLANGLIDDNTVAIATQSIKSVISKKSKLNEAIVKSLIPKILEHLIKGTISDPRLSIELFILTVKQIQSEEKQIPLFTILIPTLIFISNKSPDYTAYLHKKTISLIQLNPQVFKTVVNEILTPDQRVETEKLVKLEGQTTSLEQVEHEQIRLKAFDI